MNDLFAPIRKKRERKWTLNRVIEVARSYEYLSEFRKSHGGAYTIAAKNKWLKHIEFLKKEGNAYLRYVYEIAEHDRKVIYIGLTLSPPRRIAHHRAVGRLQPRFQRPIEMTLVSGLISSNVAKLLEQELIDLYKSKGYTVLNSAKAGALGCATGRIWNNDSLHKEALKYESKTGFRQGSNGAYLTAIKLGILKEISTHMKRPRNRNEKWTTETVLTEAAKYDRYGDFMRGSSGAYDAARRLDCLSEIRKMFPTKAKPSGFWSKDRCREEFNKYGSLSAFKKAASSAYTIANRNNWTREFISK